MRSPGCAITATLTATACSSTATRAAKGWPTRAGKTPTTRYGSADGRIAATPVTLCEVQGYAYQAAIAGAGLLDALRRTGRAQWRAWAARLAHIFRSRFWVTDPDGAAYPALALDGSKRQVDSLTSNIGHLLGTGLLTRDEETRVAERLEQPDMNSGFGLRTMSAANAGYSPLSYHCGSVWSHDTAIVILGLIRSGHQDAAASLADGLLEAAAAFGWRLPELFTVTPARGPVAVALPAVLPPQAWAAAAAGALVQALLGLDVDVPAGSVRISPARPRGRACPPPRSGSRVSWPVPRRSAPESTRTARGSSTACRWPWSRVSQNAAHGKASIVQGARTNTASGLERGTTGTAGRQRVTARCDRHERNEAVRGGNQRHPESPQRTGLMWKVFVSAPGSVRVEFSSLRPGRPASAVTPGRASASLAGGRRQRAAWPAATRPAASAAARCLAGRCGPSPAARTSRTGVPEHPAVSPRT